MAEPVQRDGKWYGRVKNAAGLWRNVILAEARTKTQARELQDALALRSRRQRDGLEPMPTDRAFTVGALLRWWLNTYVAGKPWAGREEDRFRLYFESTDFVRLPLVALTAGRLELFLQHWSQKGLGPASVNKLRDGADSVQPRSSRRPGAWPESRVGHEAAQGSEACASVSRAARGPAAARRAQSRGSAGHRHRALRGSAQGRAVRAAEARRRSEAPPAHGAPLVRQRRHQRRSRIGGADRGRAGAVPRSRSRRVERLAALPAR